MAVNHPKGSRLLSLPLELRTQIYRELLLPDQSEKRYSSYHMHPVILRVSKQIYAEAKRVLYDDTCWVLMTTNRIPLTRQMQKKFYASIPVDSLNGQGVMVPETTSEIQIEILTHRRRIIRIDYRVLATLSDARRILRAYMYSVDYEKDEISVAVTPKRGFEYRAESIREALRDIYGIKTVNMTCSTIDLLGNELARQMTQKVRHVEEILRRVRANQRYGDKDLALGHFNDAYWSFNDSFQKAQILMARALRDENDTEIAATINDETWMLMLSCAYALIRQGEHKRALMFIYRVQDEYLSPSDRIKSLSYLYEGLALMSDIWSHRIAYRFIHDSIFHPEQDYEEADWAIVESTLREETTAHTTQILESLKFVLGSQGLGQCNGPSTQDTGEASQ